jgi:hypothetical protein
MLLYSNLLDLPWSIGILVGDGISFYAPFIGLQRLANALGSPTN